MRIGTLFIAGLLALAGCAETRSAARATGESAEQTFDAAYEAVKTGAEKTAEAGGWLLSRAADGTVQVMRAARLHKAARYTEDRAITARIKGTYLMDPDVRARDIDVDTRHGVVTLSGTVGSPAAARKAIRQALDEKGVIAVRSDLQFPSSQARIYRPGQPVRE